MLDFKSPYQQLLHNCGKSTLFSQRLQKLMEVIYRILNGFYPSYLNNSITVEELQHLRCQSSVLVKPGLHSIRRTYATEMRKLIYASHARRGVYTPRVDLGAYTQKSTQCRLRTISGRWIYFICRVKACVYA